MTDLLPHQWINADLRALAQVAPIQWLDWPELSETGIELGIKREDLLHPHLGGNKLYKLHGHLNAARRAGQSHIVSFGGAWSNHIYALAAAGYNLGFQTTGVIRGEEPARLSAMLEDVQSMGMKLHFISRDFYRQKDSEQAKSELMEYLGPCHMVPEGGGDRIGAMGCRALGQGLGDIWRAQPFDVVCCAAGTGGTLAGLAAGLPKNVQVCGFSVLKGEGGLQDEVRDHLEGLGSNGASWCLETAYHCGGYARFPEALAQFVQMFESQTGVLLDPVYTAKMIWGIFQKAHAGDWPRGARIVALHSGGLQGRRGLMNTVQIQEQ